MNNSEMVHVDRDGRRLPVFVTCPADKQPNAAVIVVHEIFGLNDHIKDVATRFANEGYLALAPDLFANAPNLPADRNDLNAMRAVWQSIPDADLISDLQAVQVFANKDYRIAVNKVGAIGYCMGGAIAYMFACSGSNVAWVADYYGRIFYPQLSDTKPKHAIDYTCALRCPVLALFAGQDELITSEHINEFKAQLEQQGVPFEVHVYPQAKHAFFNDTREFYNQEAAIDAWKRTLAFISKSLAAPANRG